MRAVLTPEDLKRGDLVEPGWYPATITKYDEQVTKDNVKTGKKSDGSMNAIFTFKLNDGPNAGSEHLKYFNEKALGFGKNLWAALDLPKNTLGGYDLSTELFKQTEGSKVMVYMQRGKGDNGKDFNEVADFKKLT